MEDEAALRLDRPAMVDRRIGRLARRDVELPEQIVEAEPRHHPAEADAERALLVMDAHRDHRFLEARIADARHGEQELAGKEAGRVHRLTIGVSARTGNRRASIAGRAALLRGRPDPNEENDMTIKVGDRIPSATLTKATADGPQPIQTDDYFAGRKIALFAVPGAFTPTCSARHLPGYVEKAGELKGKGVDEIACVSVNDAFVMQAWGAQAGADGKVTMLADGNGDFAEALGLAADFSKFGMGKRSQRWSAIVEDGVVKELNVEEPGAFSVSSADYHPRPALGARVAFAAVRSPRAPQPRPSCGALNPFRSKR